MLARRDFLAAREARPARSRRPGRHFPAAEAFKGHLELGSGKYPIVRCCV